MSRGQLTVSKLFRISTNNRLFLKQTQATYAQQSLQKQEPSRCASHQRNTPRARRSRKACGFLIPTACAQEDHAGSPKGTQWLEKNPTAHQEHLFGRATNGARDGKLAYLCRAGTGKAPCTAHRDLVRGTCTYSKALQWGDSLVLGFDSPFFSTIVLFKKKKNHGRFPCFF